MKPIDQRYYRREYENAFKGHFPWFWDEMFGFDSIQFTDAVCEMYDGKYASGDDAVRAEYGEEAVTLVYAILAAPTPLDRLVGLSTRQTPDDVTLAKSSLRNARQRGLYGVVPKPLRNARQRGLYGVVPKPLRKDGQP